MEIELSSDPVVSYASSDQLKFGNNLGTKPRVQRSFFGFGLPQGQSNHQAFGGSVWESNPPFDPQRTESPALKTGKVTGPLSPPML